MGKVTPFHGRPTGKSIPLTPPIVPSLAGIPGDRLVTRMANQVLAHAADFAQPGKTGWKLDLYGLSAAIIDETAARWRNDQP